MVGFAAVVVSAAQAAQAIKRAAARVREARAAGAGSPLRGVLRAAFPDTLGAARAEIEGLRERASAEIEAAVSGLREEIAALREARLPTEDARGRLAAALQCRCRLRDRGLRVRGAGGGGA